MLDAKGVKIPVQTDSVEIPAKTVTLNSSMNGTTKDGKKIVEVQSEDFLKDVNYTHAGIYVYKVTETQNTYNIADPAKEKMTYSKAEYTVYVYVANKDNGGVYVKAVGVLLTKNDAGTQTNTPAENTDNVAGKVDPTPNPNPDPNGGTEVNNSKMKFVNTYLKTNGGGGDPTVNDNKSLQISKTVTGDFGDKTKYFDFAVTVKKPAVDTDTKAYKGYIINTATNQVVDPTAANANGNTVKDSQDGKKYIEFDLDQAAGTATKNIKLKHGEELVFSDVSVGTHFQAVESAAANYETKLTVKVNNETVVNEQKKADSEDRIIGEARENSARFTNAYRDITPTGILMNSRSFVMMIGVAVLAMIVLAVLKNRKRKYMA
ncbi:MAG: hypothetical protein SPL15_01450 [Lachnospiraceae bacterium]|nr:hypothetical protein [Lachnospiraceae bacterium]MDY5741654.1 hypothetical protein [Lachnospiraceae bacterium]